VFTEYNALSSLSLCPTVPSSPCGYALARLVEWGEALLNPFFISKIII
jgi:hypothetical protein